MTANFLLRPLKKSLHTALAVTMTATLALMSPAPASAFDLTPPKRGFEEERMRAASQHEQVLAQFGGLVDNVELAAYVTRVGNRMAAASDMPDRPFDFFVLNTPMVNAFTVGGGYVYVTRGILASINSEAELAALLGHEIGHVTARHTARRETRMQQDRAASIGVGLLTGSLSAALLTNAVSKVGQQAYSRGQEAESDELGVKSMLKAGYDPYAMHDMLGALDREVALMTAMSGGEAGGGVPAWLQDHPQTDDRMRDTLAQAKATGMKPGSGEVNHNAHLRAVDGVMFGADPAGGVRRDGQFVHPGLAIAFDVQDDYQLVNQQGILMGVRDDENLFMFAGAEWSKGRSLTDFAKTAWYSLTEGDEGGLDHVENTRINGLEAVISTKHVKKFLSEITLASVAYRTGDDTVLGLTFVSEGKMSKAAFNEFRAIAESFRTLTYAEVNDIKPHRVDLVQAAEGDTAESLSKRMAFENFQLERFVALNGVDGPLEAGRLYKIVVQE